MMKKLVSVLLALTIVLALSVTAFAAPPKDLIGEAKAKEIALDDAGYSEDEVKFVKVKLDFDDGIYEYEIEFRVGSAEEFEYTIHAESGKILDYDYDYDPPRYDIEPRVEPDYDDIAEDKFENWLDEFIRELIAFIRAYFA